MEFKRIEAQTVYCETVTTTLRNIAQYVGTTPARLMTESAEAGFKQCAPQIWLYNGTTGNPDDEFQLTIAIPVEGESHNHAKLQKLDSFYCAEQELKGSWDQFPTVYPEIIGNLIGQKKEITNVCREVYHEVDFNNPDNNWTAIQIGIKEN